MLRKDGGVVQLQPPQSGCSAAVARLPWEQKVDSSSLSTQTNLGEVKDGCYRGSAPLPKVRRQDGLSPDRYEHLALRRLREHLAG